MELIETAIPSAARETSSVSTSPARDRFAAFVPAIVVGLVVWVIARCIFFQGLEGSDDLFHMRYAALLDRVPLNHWETRLITNLSIAGAMRIFGRTEFAGALPGLVSSLVMQMTVYYVCWRYARVRHAWWAGLIAALLPVNVQVSTAVSSYGLLACALTVGTALFLDAPTSRRARLAAAVFLGMAAVVHLYGGFYVAFLCLAGVLFDRRQYFWPAMCAGLGVAAALLLDMAVFKVLTGSFLGHYNILRISHLTAENVLGDRPVDAAFLIRPWLDLLINTGFGTAMAVAIVGGLCYWRRLSSPLRLMVVATSLLWLFFNYGSQVPWEYKPIWRYPRYLYPTMLMVVVLAAAVIVEMPRWRGRLLGATVLAACVLLLLSRGSWGRNVQISRELLAYAKAHPDQHFVTDVQTMNELYVLNQFCTPPNVVGTIDMGLTHFLDPTVQRVADLNTASCDAILLNPLNLERYPSFARLIDGHTGKSEFAGATGYRDICRFVPQLRSQSWAVNQPPAQVREFVGGNQAPHHASTADVRVQARLD